MTLLKLGILFCTLCSTSVLTDDEVADLIRRVEQLASHESAGPRAATLGLAARMLEPAFPVESARFREQARQVAPQVAAPAADRTALERAIASGDKNAVQSAGREFLSAVEQGGENPGDYDWFAAQRTYWDIVAGSDNPSVRVRQALAELAELVRMDYDFSLRDLNGRQTRLRDQRGKTVVVAFWATWCAPCQEEMPLFDQLSRQGTTVFAVTDEAPATVRAYLASHQLTVPVLVDPARTAASMFRVDAMPGAIVLDGTGRIRARLGRTNGAQLTQVLERLRAISSGRRPS